MERWAEPNRHIVILKTLDLPCVRGWGNATVSYWNVIKLPKTLNYDILNLFSLQRTSFSTPEVVMTRKFTKAEVLLTRVAEQIGTKFRRLYLCFQGRATNELTSDIVRLRSKPDKQNGGYQTGSTCISRSIVDRNETRNVISKFTMSARPMNSSPTPADIVRHR